MGIGVLFAAERSKAGAMEKRGWMGMMEMGADEWLSDRIMNALMRESRERAIG